MLHFIASTHYIEGCDPIKFTPQIHQDWESTAFHSHLISRLSILGVPRVGVAAGSVDIYFCFEFTGACSLQISDFCAMLCNLVAIRFVGSFIFLLRILACKHIDTQ